MQKNGNTRRQEKSTLPKYIHVIGYVKPERNGYVAICVNLSLFAQGRTQTSALNKLRKAIDIYLRQAAKNYADEWEKYTNRPAPKSILAEFENLARTVLEQSEMSRKASAKAKKPKKTASKKTKPQVPNLTFTGAAQKKVMHRPQIF